MTVQELRKYITELFAHYWGATAVEWTGMDRTAEISPKLLVSMRNVMKPVFPHTEWREGVEVSRYPASAMLELNLYTKGMSGGSRPGLLVVPENSAVNDLAAFLLFLESPFAVDWCMQQDISLVPAGNVTDVSAVMESGQNEYRAMAEITVSFPLDVSGAASVLDGTGKLAATGSGADTEKLGRLETGYFTCTEIEMEE